MSTTPAPSVAQGIKTKMERKKRTPSASTKVVDLTPPAEPPKEKKSSAAQRPHKKRKQSETTGTISKERPTKKRKLLPNNISPPEVTGNNTTTATDTESLLHNHEENLPEQPSSSSKMEEPHTVDSHVVLLSLEARGDDADNTLTNMIIDEPDTDIVVMEEAQYIPKQYDECNNEETFPSSHSVSNTEEEELSHGNNTSKSNDTKDRDRDTQQGDRDTQQSDRDTQQGDRDIQQGDRDIQQSDRDTQQGEYNHEIKQKEECDAITHPMILGTEWSDDADKVILDDVPTLEQLEVEHQLETNNVYSDELHLTSSITKYGTDEPNKLLFDHIIDVSIAFMANLSRYGVMRYGIIKDPANKLPSNKDLLKMWSNSDDYHPMIIIDQSTGAENIVFYINSVFRYITDRKDEKDEHVPEYDYSQETINKTLLLISPKLPTSADSNYGGGGGIPCWHTLNISSLTLRLETEKCLHRHYDFDNLKWALSTTIQGPSNLFGHTGLSLGLSRSSSSSSTLPPHTMSHIIWNILLISILFKTETSTAEVIYTKSKPNFGPEVRCDFMRPLSWGIERISALSSSLDLIEEKKTIPSIPVLLDVPLNQDVLYTIIHTVWIARYVINRVNLNGSVVRRAFIETVYFLLPTYIMEPENSNTQNHNHPKSADSTKQSGGGGGKVLPNSSPQTNTLVSKDILRQGKRLGDFIRAMTGISMKNQVLQAHPFEVHTEELSSAGFKSSHHTHNAEYNTPHLLPPDANTLEDALIDDIFDEISRESRLKANMFNYTRPLSAIACSQGMSYEFVVDLILDIKRRFLRPSIYTKTHDFVVLIRSFDFNIITPIPLEVAAPPSPPPHDYSTKPKPRPHLYFFPYHCWWIPHEINFLFGKSPLSIFKAVKVAEAIINIEQLGDIPSSLSMIYRTHITEKTHEARTLAQNPNTRLLANPIYSKFEQPIQGLNKVYNGYLSDAPTLNSCYFTVDLGIIISFFLKIYSTLQTVLDYPLLTLSQYRHHVPLSIAELYNQSIVNCKNNRSLSEAVVRKCTLLIIHIAVEVYSRGFLSQIIKLPRPNTKSNHDPFSVGLPDSVVPHAHDTQADRVGYFMWVLTAKHLVYCPRLPPLHHKANLSLNNMYNEAVTPRMRDVGHSSGASIWYLFNGASDGPSSGSKIPVTTSYKSVVPLVRKTERGVNPISVWVDRLKENMDDTESTLLVHNKTSRKMISPYYKLNIKDLVSRWEVTALNTTNTNRVVDNIDNNDMSPLLSNPNNLYITATAEMLGALMGDKNNCLVCSPIKIYDNDKITILGGHIRMGVFSSDDCGNNDEDLSDFVTSAYGCGEHIRLSNYSNKEKEEENGIDSESITQHLKDALYIKTTSNSVVLDALDIIRILKSTLSRFIKSNAHTTILVGTLHISKPTNIALNLDSVAYRLSPNIPRSIHQLSLFDSTATTISDIPLEIITKDHRVHRPPKDHSLDISNSNITPNNTGEDMHLNKRVKVNHASFRKIGVILKTQLLGLIFSTPLISEFDNVSLSPNSNLSTIIITYHIAKHGIDKYTVVYPVFNLINNEYTFLYVPVSSKRTIELLLSEAVCIIKPTSK